MDFPQFLVLLVISVAVSAILHYGFSYYVVEGTKSFYGKIVIAYLGAYFAGYFVGQWEFIPGLAMWGVPVLPAILGSIGMTIFAVDITKTLHGHKEGYHAA